MCSLVLPSPLVLRAAAFSLETSSPEIPFDILAESPQHLAAVGATLLAWARAQEAEPGAVVEVQFGDDGTPFDVARDAWLLGGATLAS